MTAAQLLQDRRQVLFGALYVEDFDAPPIVPEPETATPEPPPEPVEPVFTAAEQDAAREEGRALGRAECERGLAASRVQMLESIATALTDTQAAAAAAAEAMSESVAQTMLSALAACLPASCAQHGEAELRALARALLPGLVAEPRVTVEINPLMIPAMTDEIALFDAAMLDRIVFVPAAQMAPGNAQIGWQGGGATRDGRRIRADVEEALATMGLLEKETIDV